MFWKTKSNLWLDITIFVAFLITSLTGFLFWLVLPEGQGSRMYFFGGLSKESWTTIHNWAGVVMLIGAMLHILLHWKWILNVGKRYLSKLAKQARINFSLNSLLFLSFVLVNLSGLVIWLILGEGGYQGGRNPGFNAVLLGLGRHEWNDLHLYSGLAITSVLFIHVVIHLKWILFSLKRYFNKFTNQLLIDKVDSKVHA